MVNLWMKTKNKIIIHFTGQSPNCPIFLLQKQNIMTPEERDEKIVSILTKICINVLVKNLFDKNGVRVYEEVLHELNQLPVNEEEYTRCNHAHSFLHKTAIEYLQKTIVFNEERKNK